MRSCTCLRNPDKYVTNPKKVEELQSELSENTNEVQSIVTDSDVFNHETLIKNEGSTTYDEVSQYLSNSDSNTSEDYNDNEKAEPTSQDDQNNPNEEEKRKESDDSYDYKPGELRQTVESWNELLKEYDNDPDVCEMREVLKMVSSLSKEGSDEESKKIVDETIRRLTSSLIELRSLSSSQMSDRELVLQPYEGDDENTYFRCFIRKLREQTGNAEVELEVNETVNGNIHALFSSLGLSPKTLTRDSPVFLTKMKSKIKTSSVFKNVLDPEVTSRTNMDLTTYLHQLSNSIDKDDLASISTLSDVEMGHPPNPLSNCLLNTSLIMDEAVCTRIKQCNEVIPEYCSKQLKIQLALRNKYGDMSDMPLFLD